MSRGYRLVLLADDGNAIALRLLREQKPPLPKIFTTRKIPFEMEELKRLTGPGQFKLGPKSLSLWIHGTTAGVSVAGMMETWTSRESFTKQLWEFISEVSGDSKPVPGSIKDIWARNEPKRKHPFATRVEDDNGSRMSPPAPPEPRRGDYRLRRLAIDPTDGKVKIGVFSGRTYGEAEQAYYRHIRRYGKPADAS